MTCFEDLLCGALDAGKRYKEGKSATAPCGGTCSEMCFDDLLCSSVTQVYRRPRLWRRLQCDLLRGPLCGALDAGKRYKEGKSATAPCGGTCSEMCFDDLLCSSVTQVPAGKRRSLSRPRPVAATAPRAARWMTKCFEDLLCGSVTMKRYKEGNLLSPRPAAARAAKCASRTLLCSSVTHVPAGKRRRLAETAACGGDCSVTCRGPLCGALDAGKGYKEVKSATVPCGGTCSAR